MIYIGMDVNQQVVCAREFPAPASGGIAEKLCAMGIVSVHLSGCFGKRDYSDTQVGAMSLEEFEGGGPHESIAEPFGGQPQDGCRLAQGLVHGEVM